MAVLAIFFLLSSLSSAPISDCNGKASLPDTLEALSTGFSMQCLVNRMTLNNCLGVFLSLLCASSLPQSPLSHVSDADKPHTTLFSWNKNMHFISAYTTTSCLVFLTALADRKERISKKTNNLNCLAGRPRGREILGTVKGTTIHWEKYFISLLSSLTDNIPAY